MQVCVSIAVTAMRKRSQTHSTAQLLRFQALFVSLIAGVPMFWLWKTPLGADVWIFGLIGILAIGGQWIGIQALRKGEASLNSALQYTRDIFAVVFGYMLFGETPDLIVLLAMGIIACSSLLLYRS
ncbi:MAG: EamA family transporter [Halocynthiibacter sp.]